MLVATISLPADAVALEYTLERRPDVEVEAERIAGHSTVWTMPCLWISSDDLGAVDEALAADPSVESVVDSDEFDAASYYHLEWADDVEERVNAYIDREGSILDAKATADGWRMRFRFVSREQFDAFRETAADRGHSFELLELTEPDAPSGEPNPGGLTPDQREALLAAHDRGYYEVPREVTTRELAAELDTSHQSLSELLRRGTASLIDGALKDPPGKAC